jgi:hypothetical protein
VTPPDEGDDVMVLLGSTGLCLVGSVVLDEHLGDEGAALQRAPAVVQHDEA